MPLEGTLRKATWHTGRKTVEIWTTAPFPYLLITVKAIDLEKVSVSDKQNVKTVYYHIDCQWQGFST